MEVFGIRFSASAAIFGAIADKDHCLPFQKITREPGRSVI
jgi:hypothetical protein